MNPHQHVLPSTVLTMISSMSLHSPNVDRSGRSKVEAISPPVTAARRSIPSKSACSIDTTPASVKILKEEINSVSILFEIASDVRQWCSRKKDKKLVT